MEGNYFRLEEVANGVYAAVVTPGVGAMGNAGIVDLGDRTLVFDTFLTRAAARDRTARVPPGRAAHATSGIVPGEWRESLGGLGCRRPGC